MTTQTALLNALASHQGRESGISATELAARLDMPVRQLRKLISAAREEGFAICGLPSTGYYMAQTPEELQASCDFLEHRAMHSLRKLSRMKKVALPVLLGQLLLSKA